MRNFLKKSLIFVIIFIFLFLFIWINSLVKKTQANKCQMALEATMDSEFKTYNDILLRINECDERLNEQLKIVEGFHYLDPDLMDEHDIRNRDDILIDALFKTHSTCKNIQIDGNPMKDNNLILQMTFVYDQSFRTEAVCSLLPKAKGDSLEDYKRNCFDEIDLLKEKLDKFKNYLDQQINFDNSEILEAICN